MFQIKRLLTFCLLLSVVLPLFTVDAQSDEPQGALWLAANVTSEPGSAPQTQVRTVDSHTLDVTLTFSGVWAQIQSGDGQSYAHLWHTEYSSFREPGQPALPGVAFNILVPQGAQLEVIQQNASSHSIMLLRQGLPSKIIPAQLQASKSEPPPPWTPPNPARYTSLSLQPERWYEVNETFQMRDYTILPLWVNPVRYRGANGEIELLEKIELRLTWPESSAALDTPIISDSPSFDRLISQIVINPPPQATLDTTNSGEGYLIITPDEFMEELAPFIAMKTGQGYLVQTTLLSEIPGFDRIAGSEANNILAIQNYIKSLDPPPVYLLLVGDTNIVPATTGKITLLKSDLYFGTLGGSEDYVPDIHVGRLPARSNVDLSNMIVKLISYSTNQYQDWHSDISFIATCDLSYDDLVINSHNSIIQDYTSPLDFHGDYPYPNMEGGDQLYCRVNNIVNTQIETEILSRVNIGRGIITYSGHGNPNAWYDSSISIFKEDIQNINSNSVYSFVSSFACSTNDYGSTTNPVGFGETWMIQANKGAIAFIGSADLTYWSQDDILERSFNAALFENPLHPVSLSAALYSGLSQVQASFPPTYYAYSDDGEGQYYWETYNLLGDPSQRLWLIPEYKFEASTPTLANSGLLNSTVRYPIEITNLGNTDSYTASFKDNTWPVNIMDVVNLPYQETGTLWVNVSIPFNAVPDEFDVVNIQVSSISDPTLTSTYTLTTTALFTYFSHMPVIFK